MKFVKKITSKFTNKKHATGGIVPKPVVGITADEFNKIYNALDNEWNEAAKRQKKGATEPSRYMKGLEFALDLLESIKPHNLVGGI